VSGLTETQRDRFFRHNFEDLMGSALDTTALALT
jgi:hypothetical protein